MRSRFVQRKKGLIRKQSRLKQTKRKGQRGDKVGGQLTLKTHVMVTQTPVVATAVVSPLSSPGFS